MTLLDKEEALAYLDPDARWDLRLAAVRSLPHFSLTDLERQEALAFLWEQAEGANKFVRAWALDSLSHFALDDAQVRHRLMPLLTEAVAGTSAAVRARARESLRRLG